eukprot:s5702_g2.t1
MSISGRAVAEGQGGLRTRALEPMSMSGAPASLQRAIGQPADGPQRAAGWTSAGVQISIMERRRMKDVMLLTLIQAGCG